MISTHPFVDKVHASVWPNPRPATAMCAVTRTVATTVYGILAIIKAF